MCLLFNLNLLGQLRECLNLINMYLELICSKQRHAFLQSFEALFYIDAVWQEHESHKCNFKFLASQMADNSTCCTSLETWVWFLEPTWKWKERTDSPKLPSDLSTCDMACVPKHMHITGMACVPKHKHITGTHSIINNRFIIYLL